MSVTESQFKKLQESQPSSEEQLTLDVIFELLKNRRRRDIFRYLMEVERTVTLSELAEQVAAWENDIEVQELNSDQRKRVYVALYQTHLPKMDKAGIIEYEQDRGNITLSENADLLSMYLNDDTETETEWEKRYLGLSLVGGSFAILFQLAAVGQLLQVLVTVAFVASVLAVSLVHARDVRETRRVAAEKFSRIK